VRYRDCRRHDLPAIDIEKNKVRERCLELYPDREELYKMVYENRSVAVCRHRRNSVCPFLAIATQGFSLRTTAGRGVSAQFCAILV
jgi:hypothetical protein